MLMPILPASMDEIRGRSGSVSYRKFTFGTSNSFEILSFDDTMADYR